MLNFKIRDENVVHSGSSFWESMKRARWIFTKMWSQFETCPDSHKLVLRPVISCFRTTCVREMTLWSTQLDEHMAESPLLALPLLMSKVDMHLAYLHLSEVHKCEVEMYSYICIGMQFNIWWYHRSHVSPWAQLRWFLCQKSQALSFSLRDWRQQNATEDQTGWWELADSYDLGFLWRMIPDLEGEFWLFLWAATTRVLLLNWKAA